METTMSLRSLARLLVVLVPLDTSGCDSDDGDGGDMQVLTGRADDETYVAIVADDRDMVLYACDGTDDTVSVTEWFQGSHEGGHFDLMSMRTSAHADGDFDAHTGTGTVHLDGQALEFAVEVTDGDAGLYFDEVVEGDVEHWGGWIVRNDGSVRGSVLNRKTGGILAAGAAAPGGHVTVDMLVFAVLRLERPAL
jgi:hypothetical protein